MKKKQNINFWVYIHVITIAIIFIAIGILFPEEFTLVGIPGLGVINYVVILYLFIIIRFFYKNKNSITS